MNWKIAVHFTRKESVAKLIEAELRNARRSVDVAVYRLTHAGLALSLAEAATRGLEVRLVLDRGKYEETRVTRELLATHSLPFRLLSGRPRPGSKMHHKFAILDRRTALTGSYNWTTESEDLNFDHLVVLLEAHAVEEFAREFDQLWTAAEDPSPSPKG